jgi:hypothetical protein
MVAEANIYQMMYMKWIAKERKKKNSGLKRGGGGRKKTRDLSLPWILGFVVSIGRFNRFVLSCGRTTKLLACLDQDPGRVLQATQEGWDETRKTSRRDPLPRPQATKMSVGAATARCSSWAFGGLLAVGSELGCHFRLGIGEGGGAQVLA